MRLGPLRIFVGAMLSAVVGCGPGIADYDEAVGDTGYRFFRTDSINKAIRPTSRCGQNCPSIGGKIIAYDFNDSVIAALRQTVNYYRCKEGYIPFEITPEIAYWVIDLKGKELLGPIDEAEFSALRSAQRQRFMGIELPTVADSKRYMSAPSALKECSEPVLVAAQPSVPADGPASASLPQVRG